MSQQLKFIDLSAQYQAYKAEIDAQIAEVLDSSGFVMGPKVTELERRLARYVGVDHCIACSSGTDALFLVMLAEGIGPGDEIITTPFTFIATVEMISLVGAQPVLVDIDEATYNIDPAQIEAAITPRTKGIVPVSLYGQPADMDAINEIAARHGVWVFEDGAQSFGATYKGRRSCGLSDMAATSFFPAKPLGCYGDGGAVFTNDEKLADTLRALRGHGERGRYQHQLVGINGRLDAIQAAVLLAKLPHFEDEVERRIQKGAYYTERLKEWVRTPVVHDYNRSVYAQYTIRVPERDRIGERLGQRGIPTAVHYPIPVHLQEGYRDLPYGEGSFPVAEGAAAEVMSLPMSAFITQEQQDRVIEALIASLP